MSNQSKIIKIYSRPRKVAIAGSLSLLLLVSSAKPAKAGIFGDIFGGITDQFTTLFQDVIGYYQDYLMDFVEFAQDGRQILGRQIGETLTGVLTERLLGDRKWLDADTYTSDVTQKYLLSPMQLATMIRKEVLGNHLDPKSEDLELETNPATGVQEQVNKAVRASGLANAEAYYTSPEAQERHAETMDSIQEMVERNSKVAHASAGLAAKADQAQSSQEVLKHISEQLAFNSRQNAELVALTASMRTEQLMATIVEQSQVPAIIQQAESLAAMQRAESMSKQIQGANTLRAAMNFQGYAAFRGSKNSSE